MQASSSARRGDHQEATVMCPRCNIGGIKKVGFGLGLGLELEVDFGLGLGLGLELLTPPPSHPFPSLMLPFSVLGARRSLAGGSCREAVPFSSPSSLAPYCLPGQTAASPFRLRLRSSSSASWSFSGNQINGLSFKMKIESDRSGVGPVRSGPGSDRSRPVQDRLQTSPVLGPSWLQCLTLPPSFTD
ncbi:hypothetical protein Cgig2_012944 [Carnegiea gigantea]|uniref:Uncharacterized protein n=1 Tax=Carnegiea gigantea TaxID=171969 RepID=A0A9Q1JLK5_9CARY|nr:hypothetical protein Cgig2_012944 [Carnegiea gigantea]